MNNIIPPEKDTQIVNEGMTRCTMLIATREIKIKDKNL